MQPHSLSVFQFEVKESAPVRNALEAGVAVRPVTGFHLLVVSLTSPCHRHFQLSLISHFCIGDHNGNAEKATCGHFASLPIRLAATHLSQSTFAQ